MKYEYILKAMEKSYSHKPHLAELPHDRRTNDPELLQERIDAIDEALKELEYDIDYMKNITIGLQNAIKSHEDFINETISQGKETIANLKKNDFNIYDYGSLPEDAHEPYGIINDYETYKNTIPIVEEDLNKLEPQLKELIKNPNINIKEEDIEQYVTSTTQLENSTARMMRLYNFGEDGNGKTMELYNDSHSLKWRADLLGKEIKHLPEDSEEFKQEEKELKALENKKQDYLDERYKTEEKKKAGEKRNQ